MPFTIWPASSHLLHHTTGDADFGQQLRAFKEVTCCQVGTRSTGRVSCTIVKLTEKRHSPAGGKIDALRCVPQKVVEGLWMFLDAQSRSCYTICVGFCWCLRRPHAVTSGCNHAGIATSTPEIQFYQAQEQKVIVIEMYQKGGILLRQGRDRPWTEFCRFWRFQTSASQRRLAKELGTVLVPEQDQMGGLSPYYTISQCWTLSVEVQSSAHHKHNKAVTVGGTHVCCCVARCCICPNNL